MPIARDESLPVPAWPNASRNRTGYKPPQSLFDCDFDKGFDGWYPHSNGGRIYPQLSRVNFVTAPGSSGALFMPISPEPYQTWNDGRYSGTNMTMRRMSEMHGERGIIELNFMYVAGGFDGDVQPRQYGFLFDLENWDASIRAIPTLRCQRVVGRRSDGTIERVDRWEIRDDNENWITIFTHRVVGPNEAKPAEEFAQLGFNYDMFPDGSGADGSTWGIDYVRIADTTILLNRPGTPQVGRGRREPQGDTGVGMTGFEGGKNAGAMVQNGTEETEPGPAWMIITHTWLNWYEPAPPAELAELAEIAEIGA